MNISPRPGHGLHRGGEAGERMQRISFSYSFPCIVPFPFHLSARASSEELIPSRSSFFISRYALARV